MGRQRDEENSKQVELWKRKNSGLSSDSMAQLIIRAINAIRKRTLTTLSGVTVNAVIDRTLLECKEKYPELIEITNDRDGLHFEKFFEKTHHLKPDISTKSLEEFLVELIDVFGKITADILTKYLHQELFSISIESPAGKTQENLETNSLSLVKDRDKK